LDSDAQAKADRAIAELKAQLETANRLLPEEQVKKIQESNSGMAVSNFRGQLKDSSSLISQNLGAEDQKS